MRQTATDLAFNAQLLAHAQGRSGFGQRLDDHHALVLMVERLEHADPGAALQLGEDFVSLNCDHCAIASFCNESSAGKPLNVRRHV